MSFFRPAILFALPLLSVQACWSDPDSHDPADSGGNGGKGPGGGTTAVGGTPIAGAPAGGSSGLSGSVPSVGGITSGGISSNPGGTATGGAVQGESGGIEASGATSPAGGSVSSGGVGGSAVSVGGGGTPTFGGSSAGGNRGLGGTQATGGEPEGGNRSAGGAMATGGVASGGTGSIGGALATGGIAAGGTGSIGGALATGGIAAGGTSSAGGTPAIGGASAGGADSAGGAQASGGTAGAGGTTGDCSSGYHRVSTGACKPILFSDDFTDGVVASDWSLWGKTFFETDGRMNVGDQPRAGFNYGHTGNGRGGTLTSHIGKLDWTDYRIDADLRELSPGSYNPYGLPSCYRNVSIMFRVESAAESWNTPESNLYYISMVPSSADCPNASTAGQITLASSHHSYLLGTGCCNNAPSSSSRTLIAKVLPVFSDGVNHCSVEVAGKNIKLWVNGVLAFDYTDDTVPYASGASALTHGGFGFAWAWELLGSVDNVVVTDLR